MKKDVPLAVLRAIEPLLTHLDTAKLTVERTGKVVFRVVDAEQGSDFFFELFDPEPATSGVNQVKVRHKPANATNINIADYKIVTNQIADAFTNWLKVIKGYQEVKTIFDDPILEKYAEDFYAEFESADPDAATASFSLKQQLLLDGALTQVIHVLQAKKDESNEEIVTELIEQAEEIQNTVTENTKQETLTKLSKFFARVQKGGIKLIKDIYPIIQKEVVGAAIKSLAEHLPTLLHQLNS